MSTLRRRAAAATLAAGLIAASGAWAQPEPSGADAGKGQTPPPAAETTPTAAASADTSAAEAAERGPHRPPPAEVRSASDRRPKDKPRDGHTGPAKPKLTGGDLKPRSYV